MCERADLQLSLGSSQIWLPSRRPGLWRAQGQRTNGTNGHQGSPVRAAGDAWTGSEMQSEMHGVMSGRCCSVLTGPGGSLLSVRVTRLDPGWRSGVGTRPMRSLGRPCPFPRPAPYWCDALARSSMAQCRPCALEQPHREPVCIRAPPIVDLNAVGKIPR